MNTEFWFYKWCQKLCMPKRSPSAIFIDKKCGQTRLSHMIPDLLKNIESRKRELIRILDESTRKLNINDLTTRSPNKAVVKEMAHQSAASVVKLKDEVKGLKKKLIHKSESMKNQRETSETNRIKNSSRAKKKVTSKITEAVMEETHSLQQRINELED